MDNITSHDVDKTYNFLVEDRDEDILPNDRVLNCEPSQNTEQDWTFEDAVAAGILQENKLEISEDDLCREEKNSNGDANWRGPFDVDYRRNWWLIGNQGSTGSCVGWATEAVFRWNMVSQNQVPRIRATRQFSPRHIWMASKETDEFINQPTTFIENSGTSLKAAVDIVRKYGTVFETDIPFWNGGNWRGGVSSFRAKASQYRLTAYLNLGSFNFPQWFNWLKKYGPILTRLDVDKNFMELGSDGILDHRSKTLYGGHAICIVGIHQNRFIIRNSWGTKWGDKGFGYAHINYAKQAFTESYGFFGPPHMPWANDMGGINVSRTTDSIQITIPV